MKILKLKLQNYGPFYGEHEFNFQQLAGQLVLVLGSNLDDPRSTSNGSGKSSLLGCLDWTVWGDNPTGDHADALVNEESAGVRGSICSGTLLLEDEQGQPVEIRRWRTKSKRGLELRVGEKDLTALDARETQKLIEQVLGLDRQIFHATVLFGQEDNWHYADATDTERMALLTRLLQLEELDVLLARAKAAEKDARSKVAETEALHAQQVASVRVKEAELEGARRAADEWAAGREDARARLQVRQRELEARKVDEQDRFQKRIAGIQPMDYQPSIQQWEELRKQRLDQLRAEIAHGEADRDQADDVSVAEAQDLAAKNSLLEEIRRSIVPVEDPPELAAGRSTLRDIQGHVHHLGEELRRLDGEAQSSRQLGAGRCSRCGQEVTAEHLAAELSRLAGLSSEAGQKLQLLRTRQTEWEQYVSGWEKVASDRRTAHQQAESRCSVLRAEIQAITTSLEEAARARERHRQALEALRLQARMVEVEENPQVRAAEENARSVSQLKAQAEQEYRAALDRLDSDYELLMAEQSAPEPENPWVAKAAVLASQCNSLSTGASSLEEMAKALSGQAALFGWWVDALGPRGLRAYILESRLQELTNAANQWVQLLTGGVMWVRFEAQKELRDGTTVNAPELRVCRWNPDGTQSERNFRSWSGGEKQRVSVAVDFGLSRLLSQRAQRPYDLLILDEVFRHLDRAGKEGMVEMLQALAREKTGGVLVVEHDADFQAAFDSRILVEKRGRRSRIVPLSETEALGEQLPQETSVVTVGQAVPADPPDGRPRKRAPRRPRGTAG